MTHALEKRLFRSHLHQAVAYGVVGFFLLGLPARPSAAETSRNAAQDYWKAAALMRTAQDPADLGVISFVRIQLPNLPASVFVHEPIVARWLLQDAPALRALLEGSQQPSCDFNLEQPGSPNLLVDHLPSLRALATRAVQVAKAYSYVENDEGAASIYTSLLGLAVHMDQDRNSLSTVFGYELIQRVLIELEGFMARNPPPDALAKLSRYFATTRRPIFHIDEHLRDRAERDAEWLLEDPDLSLSRIRKLYEGSKHQPAVDHLITLSPMQREERVHTWVEHYQAVMNRLAEACSKPYQIGLYQIRNIDSDIAAMRRTPAKLHDSPLLPLLVPTVAPLYERVLLGEAHYSLADILCAVALYRGELKVWPRSLRDAEKFVGRTFGRDMFSGEEVGYRLQNSQPVIAVRAPKWLAETDSVIFKVDLAARIELDEKRLARYLRGSELQAKRERIVEEAEAKIKEKKK